HAMPTRHREGAQVISPPAGPGSDEISQGVIELPGRLVHLLPERVENGQGLAAALVRVELDVIAVAVGWEEAVNAASSEEFLADDFIQELLRVVKKLPSFDPELRIIENRGVASAQFPGMEKW